MESHLIFNSLQLETLKSLANRIVPQDDTPGAWESGAESFLTRFFTDDLKSLETCSNGLNDLENESIFRANSSFHLMQEARQDALLKDIESGEIETGWRSSPVAFFTMMVNLISEGYYANPEQGGNSGGTSWTMIGFK